jgi:hypothetical protein
VHVCRRWRYLIFASPNRLNLLLFCTQNSPVRALLDVWPAFPLAIQFEYPKSEWDNPENTFDILVAALERRDRICQIHVRVTDLPYELREHIVTAMEEPFPALGSLSLSLVSNGEIIRLPGTFLNGSAPCLQHLSLRSILFPSLPRLLSSTSDLRSLHLFSIPRYIPPETMATCLSVLPKLESLAITFTSHPRRINRAPPPPTRFVLPVLTKLEFTGISEYLEALASRFDAPLLDEFKINFIHQPELVFDIPQTIRLFDHLKSIRPSRLALHFYLPFSASILFSTNHGSYALPGPHTWHITCNGLDWQVVSVAQICSQIRPFLHSVESLVITSCGQLPYPNMDVTTWLQIFHSFPSVRSLSICDELEPFIAAALQGLTGESAAGVLPSLQRISITGCRSDETVQQGIQSFLTARQHSGHPVAVLLHFPITQLRAS